LQPRLSLLSPSAQTLEPLVPQPLAYGDISQGPGEQPPGEANDGAMKTLRILGGMSGVASAEYYPRINEGINTHRGGHAAAELVLYNADFAVIVHNRRLIRAEQRDKAAEYLTLATNTMHRVAVELQDAICIPLIHTVATTVDAVTTDGGETLGLDRKST